VCTSHQSPVIDEMVRNCTDNSSYVPIGFNPTFKLGYFYVTQIVFPLKMLVAKSTGKSPIYLGPLLIYQSLKFSNYHYFVSQVIGLRPSLKNTKAIGTDGEGPLYEAICGVFPKIPHKMLSHFDSLHLKNAWFF